MPRSLVAESSMLLTNAAQVRALSKTEAALGNRVALTGVVTFSDTSGALLFVQDSTGGVFVAPQSRVWDLRPGQRVNITGVAAEGSHLPYINEALIEDLGFGSMPSARPTSFLQLETDSEDGNWIEVRGVVRSAAISEEQLHLTLAGEGRQLHAIVADKPLTREFISGLLDAEVSIQGVCGMVKRNGNSPLLLEVHVPNLDCITVKTRPTQSSILSPTVPLANIATSSSAAPLVHRVHARGKLSRTEDGAWRLADSSGAVVLHPATTVIAETNSGVDVFGFPGGNPADPILEDAIVSPMALSSPESSPGAEPPQREYLPVLTSAEDIRNLPGPELSRGYPVRIQGVVSYVDAPWRQLFIEDKTCGIYVMDSSSTFDGKKGESFEVEGFSATGMYAPIIRSTHFRKLSGNLSLQKPRKPTLEQLFSGEMDSQRVEIEGIVRYVNKEDNHFNLHVSSSGALLKVFVPAKEFAETPTNLVDAEVLIRGVCGVSVTSERQFSGVGLYVSSLEDVRIVKPAPVDPFALPLRSIGNLLRFQQKADLRHRIHVRGTVTFRDPRFCTMFISDASNSLYVCTSVQPLIAVGDSLDVAGFINANSHGPLMTEGVFRRIGPGIVPDPIEATAEAVASGKFDARLVTLTGHFVEPIPGSGGYGLLLQSGHWSFVVWLEGTQSASRLAALQPGSLLRVTGVCSVQQASTVPASCLFLWLRTPADLVVLKPPTWTAGQLGAVLGLMALILAGTGGWVVMLRRSVRNKTADLLRSEVQLNSIYDNTPIMMFLVNERYEVEKMNRAMMEFLQPIPGEPDGRRCGNLIACVHAGDHPQGCGLGAQCATCPLHLSITTSFKTGQSRRQVEHQFSSREDSSRSDTWVSASTALMRVDGVSKVLVCLEDISGRKRLEAQFLQAQKMEAIGQLAGGVAHDFNNILTAAIMNISFLRRNPALDRQTFEGLIELEKDTFRAADLTRQLLLFSRRQAMAPKRLDLIEVVTGLMKLLQRLLGENIEMRPIYCDTPAWIDADRGMIEQMITNLCVNARDAMPQGGNLSLRVTIVQLGAEQVAPDGEARAGQFVCLSVEDTGIGMDARTMKRIFEPFFTTKEIGKGTGLGLATVYGIVKQHQGWVEVQSVVNQGTLFRVYLPVGGGGQDGQGTVRTPQSMGGTETILFVEDDPSLRRVVSQVLRQYGYSVLEARTGVQALSIWEQHNGRIDLLLTDMVMPEGMSGLDLAERLRQLRPTLKVVLSSGYSLNLALGIPQNGMRTLPKPYESNTLVKTVRAYLDEKEPK